MEIVLTILKVVSIIGVVTAAYSGGRYYRDRANKYEKEISSEERRRKAVEHFEKLEE